MLILTPSNVVFTLPSNDTSLSTWLPYMHVYILGHEALSCENTVRNHCCTISKQVKVVNIVNHWTVLSCPFEGSL